MSDQSVQASKLKIPVYDQSPVPEVTFSKDELRSRLSRLEFQVTQNKSTEKAFSGHYLYTKDSGDFTCIVCGNLLFTTDKKFDSGTGWPSFTDVAGEASAVAVMDFSFGTVRTEVACRKCGAHLGHVFDDGPSRESEGETALRYCINSVSLKFAKRTAT